MKSLSVITTALCLLLVSGAMAWMTRAMLRMERTQDRMAEEAQVQERTRLALWRMESIASALVVEESARPPEHYRPFAEPESVFGNKDYQLLKPGEVLTPSPLLQAVPQGLLLHFEMDEAGRLRSPQAPEGRMCAMACSNGFTTNDSVSSATGKLEQLRTVMAEKVSAGLLATVPPPVQSAISDNRVWLQSYNELTAADDQNKVQAGITAEQFPATRLNQVSNWKASEAQAQQLEINQSEAQARQTVTDFAKSKVEGRRSPPNSRMVKKEEADKPVQNLETKSPAPGRPAQTAAAPVAATAPVVETPGPPPGPRRPPETVVSGFRPVWIGEALLLTRRADSGGRSWIQGAWLDWPKLREDLLSVVRSQFPEANLLPAALSEKLGQHQLASLPLRFIPGAVTFAPGPFWTPMKYSLAIAWLCVLVAAAGVGLVIRGMVKLGARRASFVSSVTHELRTPLATFKLYSEMLADGMVKDAAKQQQYLETLTTEADRLGHLVENVLAYSRLERGRTPRALSTITVRDLLTRMEPRLNQRALMAGMDFLISCPPEINDLTVKTETGALEQIVFNLVDNACKYGRKEGTAGRVELVLTRERRSFCLAVRDGGPGISRRESHKLFRPFHKSAREAAHSAPGVGLGLALSRRLAAELGGRLEIDHSWRHGACFVLRLPLA